ncbi:hypothetical protein OIDMADRAFT_91883, partial [Oidiodendron maius Zn]
VQERQANWTVGQVVQTSSGPVTGHPASNSTDVSEYLGIPFAVPPLGDLRWTAPQRFNGTDPINGTSFGFSCPIATSTSGSAPTLQPLNVTQSGLEVLALLAQVGDKFSEDCLTINVWTKPQTGDPQKAVLVWIYGGGFSTGNSDNPGYNGQYFAEQEDVVLVSFNYRLNVFGFPGIPNATQNLGLLDQRLAIEWVRDNIAAFGGDPSRITIFGQSAGSASVDYYTYAWASDPIVHSYIEESGSVFGPAPGLGSITADIAAGSWLSLSSALGCGSPNSTNSSSTTILSCMKSQSMPAIVSAMATMDASSQSPIPSNFGPTVDNVVVFSNYTAQSMAGNFSTLPLLLGNADYEAGLFRILDALKNVSLTDAAWDAFNSDTFVCPCATRANFSLANKVPTWRYRWFGAFPNTELTTIPFSGAWHASELPVLFNNVPFGAGVPPSTDAEVQIGDYIRGAWAAFAKDPVNGLTSYQDGWPMYDPSGETLIRLGFNNQTGTNLA